MKTELVCIPCARKLRNLYRLELSYRGIELDAWPGDVYEGHPFKGETCRLAFGRIRGAPPAEHGIKVITGDSVMTLVTERTVDEADVQFTHNEVYLCDSCNHAFAHEGNDNRHAFGFSIWTDRSPYDYAHPWEGEILDAAQMTEAAKLVVL